MKARYIIILAVAALLAAPAAVHAQSATKTDLEANNEELAAKKAEIAELTKKIEELRQQKDTTAHEANLIEAQVQRLQGAIRKAELEIRHTRLSIADVAEQQEETEVSIEKLQEDIKTKREQLRAFIRLLYQREQVSLIAIMLDQNTFGEALAEKAAIEELQDRSIALVKELQAREQELRRQEAELEQQHADLQEFQQMLAVQQADLSSRQQEQTQFLSAKRSEQAAYEQRIAEAQAARTEIEQGLFQLKDAGVKLSLTEATDMARYASKLTGVRAALLLGVLKVESNIGNNIGSGKFPDDMQPASREPFLRITAKLGLDPYTAPISARPRSYQGWGGAMGPAQIMPQTWETIEGRLAQLMDKPQPDPYDLTDAFVATALFLADRGATSPEGEHEAVGRYLAGPNWQRFTWYNDRVFAVAREYEKEGL